MLYIHFYRYAFYIEAIGLIADFTTNTNVMTALAAGTEQIISLGAQTIGAPTNLATVNTITYTNQNLGYVAGTTTNGDVYVESTTQTILVVEDNTFTTTPSLTCSAAGSTSISYTISNYLATTAPAWVTIDSTTGMLTIVAPSVSVDTVYSFYVTSTVTGITDSFQILIQLTIANCAVSNCQRCSVSSASSCDVYIPTPTPTPAASSTDSSTTSSTKNEYNIRQNASPQAEALGTTTSSVVGSSVGVVAVSSLSNTTSMSSLWLMICQIQMLFLFLLIPSYIPDDIKAVIKGPKFTVNLYDYSPTKSSGFIKSLLANFNFLLTKTSLEDFGVNSDSSIYNIYPFVSTIFCMAMFHILLYFSLKCILKIREENCCKKLIRLIKTVCTGVYHIMAFGFYIRNCYEMSQLILVFSIYEIYNFNRDGSFHIISLSFAMILIILYLIFVSFVLLLIISNYKIDEDSHDKLGELLKGTKHTKKARFIIVGILIRKLIFIIILVCFNSSSPRLLLGFLCAIQVSFTCYSIIQRPYLDIKANIIEIINNTYYLLLLAALFFLQTKSDWSPTKTTIYTWMISSNSMVAFCIIFGDGVVTLIRFIIRTCSKNSTSSKIAPKTSPVEESKENSNKSQTFDKMQTPKESNMELVDQDQDQESIKNQIDNQFEEQKNQSFNDENNQIQIVKITVKDWNKQ